MRQPGSEPIAIERLLASMEHLRAAYRAETVSFPWQKGDLLMLDNMLVAHGRAPYSGPREILVGMAFAFAIGALFAAVSIAGSFLDTFIGFSMGSILDPITGAATPMLA